MMKSHWLTFQQTKGLNDWMHHLIDFFNRPVRTHKTNSKHRDSRKAYEKKMWRHPGGHSNSIDNSHHPRNPWLRTALLQPLSRLLPEASFPLWTSVAWDATEQNSQLCHLSKIWKTCQVHCSRFETVSVTLWAEWCPTPFVTQQIFEHLCHSVDPFHLNLRGGKCQETCLQSQVLKQSRTIGFLFEKFRRQFWWFEWFGLMLRNGWNPISWKVAYMMYTNSYERLCKN